MALDVSLADLTPKEPAKDKLVEIFTELEFKNWLKQLLNDEDTEQGASSNQDAMETNYETDLDEKTFKKRLKRLRDAKLFAFDTDTTSNDNIAADLVGVTFAGEAGEAANVPDAHCYEGAPEQLSRE